eukprot:TRINITY_DN660_c1_g1_i2.p2 TRINITY_DN660_c1_g1~~TRINITY_DN660_c1_g1_i2.p2  ORF type:complete len:169 (-),score=9.06 TRINITY_DN660_c1_g1_i2:269-754(-)
MLRRATVNSRQCDRCRTRTSPRCRQPSVALWYETNNVEWVQVLTSGGMPSSHSALIMGLTAAIGVKNGTDSSIFALCLVISLIVMYDAANVRQAAGRHASLLNLIVSGLPLDHPVQDTLVPGEQLRVTLGHTPLQVVCGAIVGLVVGYMWQITFVAIVDTR